GLRVRVLDELLRDRRTALDGLLVPDVRPHGACDPAQVEPAMLEEALVLDRDDRLLHERRYLRRGNDHAALRPAQHGEDRVAVACGEPPPGSRVAATVPEAGTRSLRTAVLTEPPPRRNPAGFGLPPAITHSSYVFPDGAAGSRWTASAASPEGETARVPARPR